MRQYKEGAFVFLSHFILFIISIVLLNPTFVNAVTLADDELTSPLDTTTNLLSIDDVIAFTLQNNLGIKIVEIDKRIAEHKVGAAKGIYDPTIRLSYERNEAEEKNIYSSSMALALPSTSHTTDKLFVAGVTQLLPSGAIVGLTYNMLRHQTNDPFTFSINPYYRSQAALSIKLPLLKNGGSYVTNAGIRIAKINRNIVDAKFRQTVIHTLYQALTAYWELVFAMENYKVQKLSLQQAEDLLRITKLKYQAGVLPATDILQTEAQVASRKDQVLIAIKTIRDINDTLKRIMNLAQTAYEWDIMFIPVDELSFEQQLVAEEKAYAEALNFRPDYQQVKDQQKIATIQRRLAEDQKLPELNVFGKYGFSSVERDINRTHDELGTLDYNQWSIGVELIFPLLNRKAYHEHQQAELTAYQLDVLMRDLEQAIRLEVRNAVRKVNTNWERIGITQKGLEFEQAKLEDELKRYEVGMATSHDVLEFQRDLANARARYLRAITDYLESLLELKTVTGALLNELNIKLEPTGP
ncbi:MAG: TolC family protein [Candidatus Sumerlaeia bacterium]|nr:TolC family protein [Candidatus Sumerlaeia bacterium]